MTTTTGVAESLALLREELGSAVTTFIERRALPELRRTGVDAAAEVLVSALAGGKRVRSTFAYLGWLCGPVHDPDDDAAARAAAASLELLHTFALMQDDVMDCSPLRRGRPSAHARFASWHREHGLSGSSDRFGESAAVLLADLCLVWAEQMLRESGLAADALARALPLYDLMRTELAVGQFDDLVNDVGRLPTLDHVLDVARRKSGYYTVRRPLELGASLADCGQPVIDRLGEYGDAIGEAFQLRDDMLDVFGSPAVTGKPSGADLSVSKATSVVVAAHQLADAGTRRELETLMQSPEFDDVTAWRTLIESTGAPGWIEQRIEERLAHAVDRIDTDQVPPAARDALLHMAVACTRREA